MLSHRNFDSTDILFSLVYLVIIFIIANFIRGFNIKKRPEYAYLFKAMGIKIFGSMAFAFVYLFYYGDGDTVYYFEGASTLTNYIYKDPFQYIRLLFSSTEFPYDLNHVHSEILFSNSGEEWFMVKIVSILNIVAFDRYFINSIIISMVSLWGSWRMFQGFLMFEPKYKNLTFWAVFGVPSVIFWGSGLLKDTITFAFLGVFFYHSMKVFFKYQFKAKSIFAITFSMFIIFNIKAYIILSFLPVLLIGWIVYNRKSIKSTFIRNIITPFLLISGIGAAVVIVPTIAQSSDKYKFENLESRLKGFHSWHSSLGGSSYDLHVTDYSVPSILAKIPASLNVTFYRPYVTEIRNAVSAIGALESLLFLVLSIIILIRLRLKLLVIIFDSPILIIALFYCIIFGFAVGFTSYNFGALARYKIPTMPFFAYLVLYLFNYYRIHRFDKAEERERLMERPAEIKQAKD